MYTVQKSWGYIFIAKERKELPNQLFYDLMRVDSHAASKDLEILLIFKLS